MLETEDLQNEKLRLENEKIKREIEKIKVETKAGQNIFSKSFPFFQILGPFGTACVTFIILYFTHFFDSESRLLEANKKLLKFDIDSLNILKTVNYNELKKTKDSLSDTKESLSIVESEYASSKKKIIGLKNENDVLLSLFRNANFRPSNILGTNWIDTRYNGAHRWEVKRTNNPNTFTLALYIFDIASGGGTCTYNSSHKNFDVKLDLLETDTNSHGRFVGVWYFDSSGAIVMLVRYTSGNLKRTSMGALLADVLNKKA